jgi:hypothetical protein
MYDVLINPNDAQSVFVSAANRPTFVSLNVGGTLATDGETLTVGVGGDVAPGIMPEGEKLRLTVYLMERDVKSDSQLFWNEDEKEEYAGVFTHPNVIREIMTPVEGIAIEAGGTIEETVETTLDPDWNLENLYLVAFVHRDGKLGGKRMHVFNTAEGEITEGTGISLIDNAQLTMDNAVYDLSGRRISNYNSQSTIPRKAQAQAEHNSQLKKGIYIVSGKKFVKK